MSKVYVLNDMNHTFEQAAKFGELTFVTKGKVPIFKTDTMKSLLIEGLNDFDLENDFLLVSGPAVLCMLAVLLLHVKKTPIKTLVFDAKLQDYVVRHLTV